LPGKVLDKTDRTNEVLEETRRPGCKACGRPQVPSMEGFFLPPLFHADRRSGGLGDFAGADAGSAHAQGFAGPVNNRMNALKIGIPPSPRHVVSVAHVVPVGRAFAANFTFTCHQKLL
jgi:hypothetical protein